MGDATKAKARAKEKAAMDKAQEKIESANAKKEREQSVADAKRAHNEIKRLVKKEVNAAKESLKNAKEKATKARAMEADEDRKVTSDDRIAGAKQAEIERLQIKLKDTTSEKKMVKIFDRINKLKAAEDGTPALVNKEKAEKIRINEARLSAKQSATPRRGLRRRV